MHVSKNASDLRWNIRWNIIAANVLPLLLLLTTCSLIYCILFFYILCITFRLFSFFYFCWKPNNSICIRNSCNCILLYYRVWKKEIKKKPKSQLHIENSKWEEREWVSEWVVAKHTDRLTQFQNQYVVVALFFGR